MNINKAAIELLKVATSAESAANGLYELSRILRGEKTMKTIKDAVIELGGKLPCNTMQHSYAVVEGMLLDRRKSPVECYVCKVEVFESCAKHLGYINGYRWGVEYPTNCKRPELADSVLIHGRYDFLQNEWGEDNQVAGEAAWHHITSFRITDPRYKPADTSYLDGVSEISGNKHDCESVSESLDCKQNQPDISDLIVALSDASNLAVDLNMTDCARDILAVCKAIKAKTEREKVIEAAMKFCYDKNSVEEMIESIYNAGMLVLPPRKSDTED